MCLYSPECCALTARKNVSLYTAPCCVCECVYVYSGAGAVSDKHGSVFGTIDPELKRAKKRSGSAAYSHHTTDPR